MANPQFSFIDTSLTGQSMLTLRRQTIFKTTLKVQLDQFRETGRYDCFELKWHKIYEDKSMWPVPFHLFWDSDLAKWMEGACYFLHTEYDEEIDAAVQYMVKTMRSAQGEDGYLNLHYTMVEPDKRWSNLRDMHELYNCGHLIEAALAHHAYYKNNLLLEVVEKYVSLIRRTFGPEEDRIHGYPGHPEIELALLRLYKATKNQDAYDLGRYFLEERGNPVGQNGKPYYEWEAEQRGEDPWKRPDAFPHHRSLWNGQAHVPILEQKTIEGHSVRAVYLLTGVADLLAIEKEDNKPVEKSDQWLETLKRLWDNMVDQRMYVTGGIGAMKQWEGFGIDYFLPQSTDEGGCYAETCASIGVMMLAERMLALELDGRYGDILELCLFNNVQTSMSLDGKAFTYVNQLGSSEADKSGREKWFWCACCPPNVSRLYGSLGGYFWHYGKRDNGAFINVHLYTNAKLNFKVDDQVLELEQKTSWPWDGSVTFELSRPEQISTTIALRIPAWADGKFTLTPSNPKAVVNKGYITLSPEYLAANPSFSLSIGGFEPRYLEPHPYTNQPVLFVARGPVIYCAEDVDNSWETDHFRNVVIKRDSPLKEEPKVDSEHNEQYVAINTTCWKRSVDSWKSKESGLTPTQNAAGLQLGEQRDLALIPYYYRANRGGNGHMRVGLLRG